MSPIECSRGCSSTSKRCITHSKPFWHFLFVLREPSDQTGNVYQLTVHLIKLLVVRASSTLAMRWRTTTDQFKRTVMHVYIEAACGGQWGPNKLSHNMRVRSIDQHQCTSGQRLTNVLTLTSILASPQCHRQMKQHWVCSMLQPF